MRLFLILLSALPVLLKAAPPAVHLEIASIPQIAREMSRLHQAVAPRFRDTAAGVTLALTLGATQYGMDLTRPAEIRFYSFGKKPVLRIFGHAAPGVKASDDTLKLWGIRFSARQQNGLVVLDSEGMKEPFPSAPPGKNLSSGKLLRGILRTGTPDILQFREFLPADPVAGLILTGLDELLGELDRLEFSFSADPSALQMELTAFPRKQSALQQWMKRPLPPKGRVETFAGAQTLAVLRLPPTETLRRYGRAYLEQGGPAVLSERLAEEATGFAVLASTRPDRVSGSVMRLNAGIVPERSAEIKRQLEQWETTPFTGWRRLRRTPPLLVSVQADRLIFFGADRMDADDIRALTEPQDYSGQLPDRPFVCIDPTRPEEPLAELQLKNDCLRLRLRAPDQWFAKRTPLLKKPLLLSAEPKLRDSNRF